MVWVACHFGAMVAVHIALFGAMVRMVRLLIGRHLNVETVRCLNVTSLFVNRILMVHIVVVVKFILVFERRLILVFEIFVILDGLEIVRLWVNLESLMLCMLMEMNWLNIMLVIEAMVKGMVCLVVLKITLLVMICVRSEMERLCIT